MAARDRLARTLRGDVQTGFSVELTARTDDLSLEVEGFGLVRFPVTPAKARKLLGLGQPARFGRTARHPRDQTARQSLHARPEQNRRAVRPRAAGTDQGRNGPGVARRRVPLTGPWPRQRNRGFSASLVPCEACLFSGGGR